MRYYFIDDDIESKEVLLDVSLNKINQEGVHLFNIKVKDEKNINEKIIYIKKLSGKFFISDDGVKWKKSQILDVSNTIAYKNRHLKIFRGFKPSGIQNSEAGDLKSQMPGKVIKVLVKKDQEIQKGQPLAILEAMKMENEIKASFNGYVRSINISEGQTIESGFTLMELEKKD